jgi:hypothetical protein
MASKARAIFWRRRDDRISSNKIVAPTLAGIWDAETGQIKATSLVMETYSCADSGSA